MYVSHYAEQLMKSEEGVLGLWWTPRARPPT